MQRSMNKRGIQTVFSLLCLCLLGFCLMRSKQLGNGVRDGIFLCTHAIVPTLFPFLILSDLLLSFSGTRRLLALLSRPFAALLRLSSYGGTVFLLGNLFGFPIGARTVAKYYTAGLLTKEEGERLLLFTGNASPFFLIGSVGVGMLSSLRIGVRLYFLQVTVSFLTGLLLARLRKKRGNTFSCRTRSERESEHIAFSTTVQKAVTQTLYICGYILFFSALISLLLPVFKDLDAAPLIPGLLEIGNATAYAAQHGGRDALAFCAFSISFCGLSVYFQTADCIKDTDLSLRLYLPIKLLCGAFAFCIVLFFTRLH